MLNNSAQLEMRPDRNGKMIEVMVIPKRVVFLPNGRTFDAPQLILGVQKSTECFGKFISRITHGWQQPGQAH